MPDQLEISLSRIGIQSLVADMEEGEVVLPDFQRDFVWPTKQVGKLLESLLNGYYINTLLTLPVLVSTERRPPFPPRWADGVQSKGGLPSNMQMVLDGQQRITSIYYALTAPAIALANTVYPQVFCLKIDAVLEGDLDEDAVDWRRRDWDSTQKLLQNDFAVQLDLGLVPFTIFKSTESFRAWRRGMETLSDAGGPITRDEINRFEDETAVFRSYEIPIIQLDADTPETKVVQTFERINTQGLELGVFDILTARLWTEDIRLRDLWEETVETYPLISSYVTESIGEERFRELTLKALALSRGEECKEKNLRELAPRGFDEDWQDVSRMMSRALKKLYGTVEGGFGVTDRFGVPYTTMLSPLAPLLDLAEHGGSYPDQAQLRKIDRWYWSSVFSKRYSGSSDTKAYKDYTDMRDWLLGEGEEPESVVAAPGRIPFEMNLDALTRGGLYRGIMCLLALNGAKDFGTFESIDLHQVDDHHIFPASRLQAGLNGKKYSDRTKRNRILNRTIIEARSNRYKYRNQLPSEYVPEMVKEHPDGESGVRKVLQGHFINDHGFEAMLVDDYEVFCAARMHEMRSAVEERVSSVIDWKVAAT